MCVVLVKCAWLDFLNTFCTVSWQMVSDWSSFLLLLLGAPSTSIHTDLVEFVDVILFQHVFVFAYVCLLHVISQKAEDG